jgi:hypothetical protein
MAPEGAIPGAAPANDNSQLESKKKTRLYSWTDEKGVIHISDIDPGS